jgi:hypothetical protein
MRNKNLENMKVYFINRDLLIMRLHIDQKNDIFQN